MCGIVGYSSTGFRAAHVLLHGLQTLEYRGYDSSGAAFFTARGVEIIKSKGTVSQLQKRLEQCSIRSSCGIAHTRWATHGAPDERNAHPHRQGSVTLVHNGIIENHALLAKELEAKGYRFHTQTDSEVACACIDEAYQRLKDPLRALQCAQTRLKGSYAFAVLFDECPDTVYATRFDSPLIVAKGADASYVASDVLAFLAYTKTYVVLEQKQIAILHGTDIQLVDTDGQQRVPRYQEAVMDAHSIEKNGHDHFMMKEICEGPDAIERTLRTFAQTGIQGKQGRTFDLRRYRKISIVACGSAYHAGMIARELIGSEAHLPVQAEVASEFRYRDPLLDAKTLVILISQSGETADTLAALKLARERGADTLAIVNVPGSSLEREADFVAHTMAGPEIAVATTKAYTAQVALLACIALQAASGCGQIDEGRKARICRQLKELPEALSDLQEHLHLIESARRLATQEHVFFIGRGLDHALCMEGSLKLKEISYIHSEAYAAGELKHGTISLIEPDTPVIAIATESALFDKTASSIREVRARGAYVILIARQDLPVSDDLCDARILLPARDRMVQPLLTALPLQLLAYHTACLRGCAIDKPRNLAKSVTVE